MKTPRVLPTLAVGVLVAALARPAPGVGPTFVDITEEAGLAWGCGLVAGDWNLVETMGGGGGFLDYDGDGRLDLLVTNFNSQGTFLYTNAGGMRFVDRGNVVDPRLLFGLGAAENVDAIEVRWPSGHVDRFPGTAANRYVTLTEGF